MNVSSVTRLVYRDKIRPLFVVIGQFLSSLHHPFVCLCQIIILLLSLLNTIVQTLFEFISVRIMCLIETYLQMATVDAELQQSNGLLVPLDENNNNNRNGSVVQPRDLLQDPNKLELVDNGLSPCYSSPNVSPVPPNTPAATTATTPTNSGESFPTIFKLFAKFGDSKSTGDNITLSNSDKWFKQAKIIDGKTITTTDTGIYFKQVAK